MGAKTTATSRRWSMSKAILSSTRVSSVMASHTHSRVQLLPRSPTIIIRIHQHRMRVVLIAPSVTSSSRLLPCRVLAFKSTIMLHAPAATMTARRSLTECRPIMAKVVRQPVTKTPLATATWIAPLKVRWPQEPAALQSTTMIRSRKSGRRMGCHKHRL